MAACTHGVQTGSTSNASTYAAGAFTPLASDLLVCMVVATDTVAAGTVSSTGNTAAWTKITSGVFAASAHTLYLFVQNALCSNTSTTVTFDCTGDAATGAVVSVVRVSGMTLTGASAVKQTAKIENQTVVTSGNPISSPTLASACLTGNVTVEFEGNDKADVYVPPASWTEGVADTTYATPSAAFEYHFRNSGFTGTNTGWADTTGFANVNYAVILAELDTSAGATPASLLTPPFWQASSLYRR